MKKTVIWIVVFVGVIGAGVWISQQKPVSSPATGGEIIVPQFSVLAAEGEVIFNGTCAACHGENLAGTENGPSLLNPYYRPAHHSDYAIVSAVRNGVNPHHWNFGPMPPLDQITSDDLTRVIAYIREIQRANGLK